MNEIILASASIGRKLLFESYFRYFQISVSDVDESAVKITDAKKLTKNLAELKASAVSVKFPEDYVIGFDTVVVCDGKTVGKPSDNKEAKEILSFLSGKLQSVISGYCIIHRSKKILKSGYSETILHFKELSPEFIDSYVRDNPVTKFAGAYAAQDSDELLTILEGDMDNVIGAPMHEIIAHLRGVGLDERQIKMK